MRRTKEMKKIAVIVLAAAAWTLPALAQDSQYRPVDQQIPPPTCLSLEFALQGPDTPCTSMPPSAVADLCVHR